MAADNMLEKFLSQQKFFIRKKNVPEKERCDIFAQV